MLGTWQEDIGIEMDTKKGWVRERDVKIMKIEMLKFDREIINEDGKTPLIQVLLTTPKTPQKHY